MDHSFKHLIAVCSTGAQRPGAAPRQGTPCWLQLELRFPSHCPSVHLPLHSAPPGELTPAWSEQADVAPGSALGTVFGTLALWQLWPGGWHKPELVTHLR